MPEVAQDLKGKVVFLRGMEAGDKLSFDARGMLIGTDTPGPFAYSTVKIEKIHRSDTELKISSVRVALVFLTKSESPSLQDMRFIPLKEPVEITIALDRANPGALDAAIRQIFAFGPGEALASMSPEAAKSAVDSVGSTAPPAEDPISYTSASGVKEKVYKPKPGGISPPKLIYSVDPAVTADAAKRRINGVCVVGMIVDTNGRPEHIRIRQSLDPGLDLNAIVAVSQYRFAPAMYQGKPVAVFIKAEVNFRIR